MFENGFFNGLSDFNGDGKLDEFEKAADFGALMIMTDKINNESANNNENGNNTDGDVIKFSLF